MDDVRKPSDDEWEWEGDDHVGPHPLAPNATREQRLQAIVESLARSEADRMAGRTVEGKVFLQELRSRIAVRKAGRSADGAADR